jgi:hypothetical protein
MNRKHAWGLTAILLLCGATLIGWNLRDPDRAFREPKSVERDVTLDQVPPAVQETIKRVSAGAKIEDIQEDRKGDVTKYEIDVIRGKTKTEFEIAVDGSVIEQESKKLK